MGSSSKVESAPSPSRSRVRRRTTRAVQFIVWVALMFSAAALKVSNAERQHFEAEQRAAAETTVIEPSGPPVEFDRSTDHSGRFPDPDYEISVRPFWVNQRLIVLIRLNVVAESRLDSLACSDGDGASLEGQVALFPSEVEWSFTLPLHADVVVDCRAVFEGRVVEFAVEWPHLERERNGRLDVDSSDLSQCRNHASPESSALPSPSDDSWSITCDPRTWQASISPSDYWLNPQEFNISHDVG